MAPFDCKINTFESFSNTSYESKNRRLYSFNMQLEFATQILS